MCQNLIGSNKILTRGNQFYIIVGLSTYLPTYLIKDGQFINVIYQKYLFKIIYHCHVSLYP